MIKCNNVQEQAQDLSVQIFARWQELLQSGDFILGDEVLAFEAWMSGRVGAAGRTPWPSTQETSLTFAEDTARPKARKADE